VCRERERSSSCDREFGKIGLRFGNLKMVKIRIQILIGLEIQPVLNGLDGNHLRKIRIFKVDLDMVVGLGLKLVVMHAPTCRY